MTRQDYRPHALLEYLIERDFVPVAEGTWFDRDTGQRVIRVLHEPGEETRLYCLDPHSVCRYEARFSPGTPDTVITAAIDAALSPPSAATGQRRPDQASPGPAAHTRRKGATRDDNR